MDYAADMDADLIVMATQGRRGFRRWLRPSVAARVARRASCPVLTVKASVRGDGEWSRIGQFRRLLVLTDFSVVSDAAVMSAIQLARRLGSRVVLLHIVEPLTPPPEGIVVAGATVEELAARAASRMTSLLARLPSDDAIETAVVTGRPARVVVDFAAAHAIDLIVLGTSSQTLLERMLGGSIIPRIVRRAPCPVLTFPYARPPVQPLQQASADLQLLQGFGTV